MNQKTKPATLPELTPKRKVGRPALPRYERRDQKITVRLTAAEVAQLTENCHQKAVAETIRELVQKGWKRKKKNAE
jgi:hypothetical protein